MTSVTGDGTGSGVGIGFDELELGPESDSGPRIKSPKNRMIAFLAAQGREAYAIAQELGLEDTHVDYVLTLPSVKAEIKRIQDSYFNSVRDRFNQLALDGLKFYEDLMKGNVQGSNKDKIQVTREVHNRANGKPVERVQVESSTIRELFERMDRQQKALESAPVLPHNNKGIIEGECVVVEGAPASSAEHSGKSAEEANEVDSWLDANTPHKAIGKASGESAKKV